jgi:hypothetical protein
VNDTIKKVISYLATAISLVGVVVMLIGLVSEDTHTILTLFFSGLIVGFVFLWIAVKTTPEEPQR